jgi:hypothetical protein
MTSFGRVRQDRRCPGRTSVIRTKKHSILFKKNKQNKNQ